jgi:macrolide transport system ATP-binding/permease protein
MQMTMFATLRQDLRHGVRMLRRTPGFAVIAFASIAIGVGANAAMFSLADGLLLRPLGVPRPGDVLSVVGTSAQQGVLPPGLSYPDYVDLRERSRTFADLVAYRNVLTGFDARPDQPALRTLGTAVNASLLDAMGVRPAIGRFFRADEDVAPGRDAVVVLDHRTWRTRFGADPAIAGRRVRIANTDFTVIGVTPESFRGLDLDVWPTFYMPLAMVDEVQTPRTGERTRRDIRSLDVKGRLAPGATLEQASEEIASIGRQLAAEHPDVSRNRGLIVRTELQLRMFGPDAMLIVMLMALAIIVLLVACANVAGLLTSRAPARAREIALRLAIGAGRFRVVRQLVTESLLIAGGGAIAGMLIAYGAITMFRQIEFPTDVPLKLFFELDGRVLGLALGLAVLSAVLSSLIPAWQATRTDLVTTIKSAVGSSRIRKVWGRESLVSLQVGLSLIVITVAAGFYAGFSARLQQGPGYQTERLLLMRFDHRLAGYDRARALQFYRVLKERARELPTVTSVALTSMVPLKTDTMEAQRVAPEGVRLPGDAADVRVLSSRVDEDFFSTLGMPIVAGRAFSAQDREDTPKVAIVNRTFADRYWPGQEAIGKRVVVRSFDQREGESFQVVGVSAPAKYAWMGEVQQEFIYLPWTQNAAAEHSLVVESSGAPEALASSLRDVVRAIDPNMPIFGVRTMADLYESRGVKIANIIVGTVAAMGGMGLLLALVGLYGLVAYAVGRRTREIGIRIAVGARPWVVLAMMLRRGIVLTAIGLGLGAAASVAAARAVGAAIPGVGNFGPEVYAVVVPTLFALTLIAAYVPARRAARVDPCRVLRAD